MRPQCYRCAAACSWVAGAVRYHSTVRRRPSLKSTRGLYFSFCSAREMSASECRTSPLRSVGDVARVSGQRLQQLERFVQGEAISRGDVERLAGYVLLWSGGSQQV